MESFISDYKQDSIFLQSDIEEEYLSLKNINFEAKIEAEDVYQKLPRTDIIIGKGSGDRGNILAESYIEWGRNIFK